NRCIRQCIQRHKRRNDQHDPYKYRQPIPHNNQSIVTISLHKPRFRFRKYAALLLPFPPSPSFSFPRHAFHRPSRLPSPFKLKISKCIRAPARSLPFPPSPFPLPLCYPLTASPYLSLNSAQSNSLAGTNPYQCRSKLPVINSIFS
ncbi:MAG: hypothetical protein QOH96_1686, partial [Blastocatellia bacterium]|nr:hypothetical protein [Blastocatellia bacterium]